MKKIRSVLAWLAAPAAERLRSLSFATGVAVAGVCVACYVISFAQMLLPLSAAVKGALWVVFYGLAKASQYTALLILGKAGIGRIKSALSRRRTPPAC